jgi:hypothetical protein
VSKYVIKFSLRLAYEDRLQYVQISDMIGLTNRKPPSAPPPVGLWVPPFHPDQELSLDVTAAADLTPGAE